MKWLSLLCLWPALLASAFSQDTAPLREWKSKAGTSLTARLLGFDGEVAVLQTEQGKQLQLSPAQLSPEDSAFLSEWAKKPGANWTQVDSHADSDGKPIERGHDFVLLPFMDEPIVLDKTGKMKAAYKVLITQQTKNVMLVRATLDVGPEIAVLANEVQPGRTEYSAMSAGEVTWLFKKSGTNFWTEAQIEIAQGDRTAELPSPFPVSVDKNLKPAFLTVAGGGIRLAKQSGVLHAYLMNKSECASNILAIPYTIEP